MANIVIIDDDPSFIRFMRRSLGMPGHVVTAYTDGRAAIAHLGRELPDLLITDIFMAEMDGLETIRRARAISSTLRIIAISGGTTTGADYLLIARHFGADATMTKPFHAAELIALVSRLLQAGPNEA